MGEQSSGCEYLGRENYGGHFLHILSTSTHDSEGKVLPFPSEPHSQEEGLTIFSLGLRLWGP